VKVLYSGEQRSRKEVAILNEESQCQKNHFGFAGARRWLGTAFAGQTIAKRRQDFFHVWDSQNVHKTFSCIHDTGIYCIPLIPVLEAVGWSKSTCGVQRGSPTPPLFYDAYLEGVSVLRISTT
jgi:hypothetical protein